MDIPIDAELYRILKHLDAIGFPSIVVGGYVRDALLGITSKDADIEVYRATCEQLAGALAEFGRVDLVGKSFGVVKLRVGNVQYDFAIPRTESKIGAGHREFLSVFNPEMKPREAAARRDLTVNAIGWDPIRKELHDYYGGVRDLRDGVLRATSEAFSEDPLRVLRVVQFAARFDMRLEPRTANMCRNLAAEYETLPRERIAEEWMKLAIKGRRFQRMFDALLATGWIEFYPELQGIVNVSQDPEWHPEGPVHVHTAHAMDAAAAIADRDRMQGDDRATLVFATMAHDLGKAATTRSVDVRGQKRIVSRGHDDAGTDLAVSLLQRMGIKIDIIRRVEKLVANHMAHISMAGHPTLKALRRLAVRLQPASVKDLVRLIEADFSGRPPLPAGLPWEARALLEKAETEHVLEHPQAPIIRGRDLLARGLAPGREIGRVVRLAYDAQCDGAFTTRDEAVAWLEELLNAGSEAE